MTIKMKRETPFTTRVSFANCRVVANDNGNVTIEFADVVPLESIAAELASITHKWELDSHDVNRIETVLDQIVTMRLIANRIVRDGLPTN